tara:strand:- start:729 stop:1049 length:321 start_codon:yes stop_codon:yes gene_type:complete
VSRPAPTATVAAQASVVLPARAAASVPATVAAQASVALPARAAASVPAVWVTAAELAKAVDRASLANWSSLPVEPSTMMETEQPQSVAGQAMPTSAEAGRGIPRPS